VGNQLLESQLQVNHLVVNSRKAKLKTILAVLGSFQRVKMAK
jgi:hypothetical protein